MPIARLGILERIADVSESALSGDRALIARCISYINPIRIILYIAIGNKYTILLYTL